MAFSLPWIVLTIYMTLQVSQRWQSEADVGNSPEEERVHCNLFIAALQWSLYTGGLWQDRSDCQA